MKLTFKVVLAIVTVLLSSCIEEYTISSKKVSSVVDNTIVIQGRVLSGGESVVYISKTSPLGSTEKPESVESAKVFIVGQKGYKSEVAVYSQERECYIINTEELEGNDTYALNVEVNGESYASDFLTLQATPEIDSVTYKEREDGVSIHVSTQNAEDASQYYMWSYEEDWEFYAPLDFIGMQGIPVYSEKFYDMEIVDGRNPYLYCWKHTESGNIFIYGTENLQENSVKDVELLRIPIDDIRISYIYSILVKQFCLSKEAYNYYKTLELYTENNGGLFTPMPNELKGNVNCISNPDLKVYGYVLASNITTKRLFIYESDFEQIRSEYENGECGFLIPDPENPNWYHSWSQMINNGGAVAMTIKGDYAPFDNPDYLDSKLYFRECVDCRSVKGSTKKRPDFWPTKHE